MDTLHAHLCYFLPREYRPQRSDIHIQGRSTSVSMTMYAPVVLQAAARAAERRARDNLWCPCGDHGTDVQYTDGQVLPSAPSGSSAARIGAGTKHHQSMPLQGRASRPAQPSSTDQQQNFMGRGSTVDSSAVNRPAKAIQQTIGQTTHADANCRKAGQSGQSQPWQSSNAGPMQHVSQSKRPCNVNRSCGNLARAAAELVDLTLDDDTTAAEEAAVIAPNKRARRQKADAHSTAWVQHPEDACHGVGMPAAIACPPEMQASRLSELNQHAADLSGQAIQAVSNAACSAALNRCPHPPGQDVSGTARTQGCTEQQWGCHTCTLLNDTLTLQCTACGTAQPVGFHLPKMPVPSACAPSSNQEGASTSKHTDAGSWTCKFCTVANGAETSHCCMCQTWRYSYGVPHTSRPTL